MARSDEVLQGDTSQYMLSAYLHAREPARDNRQLFASLDYAGIMVCMVKTTATYSLTKIAPSSCARERSDAQRTRKSHLTARDPL
jgi:hypothetical protein